MREVNRVLSTEFSLAFTFASFQLQIGELTETLVQCERSDFSMIQKKWFNAKHRNSLTKEQVVR